MGSGAPCPDDNQSFVNMSRNKFGNFLSMCQWPGEHLGLNLVQSSGYDVQFLQRTSHGITICNINQNLNFVLMLAAGRLTIRRRSEIPQKQWTLGCTKIELLFTKMRIGYVHTSIVLKSIQGHFWIGHNSLRYRTQHVNSVDVQRALNCYMESRQRNVIQIFFLIWVKIFGPNKFG